MTRWLLALALIPSVSLADGWKRADAPFSRTPKIMSSSTDAKIGLYTKGSLLKVGPQLPSGRSSLSSTMYGDVEISVAKRAGVKIPDEKKGAIVMTHPGDSLATVANQLVSQGVGKIVKTEKNGAIIIDTSR